MKEKIKVAIFGGSFDPFHIGHKRVVEGLIKLNKFDKIIVMPLGLAPHKKKYMTPAGYRAEMTRLGLLDLPQVEVSNYEINRPGKYSYTLDTIQYFEREIKLNYLKAKHSKARKKRRSGAKARTTRDEQKFQASLLRELIDSNLKVKLYLVYGSDALDTIESWHEPAQLLRSTKLLICRRGGENIDHIKSRADFLKEKYGAKIKFFDIEETSISGTSLRKKLRKREEVDQLLPKMVEKFIRKNSIYKLQKDMEHLNAEELIRLGIYENEVRKLVSRSRLVHSLNVMQYAVHLAVCHSYDPFKAATAGILHDIAKQMDISKQYRYAAKIGMLSPLNKNIAHGPAGAYYIKKFLGIQDQEILDALIFHTTSRPAATTLDKIIFLADKLEYGRPFKNLDKIREAADRDLDLGLASCLTEVKEALAKRSRTGHPLTMAAIDHFDELGIRS